MRTLGEFYREKILTCKKLMRRELPSFSGHTKVAADLFGWKLYCDGEFIECRSEEEARYLKVFLDAGMTEVLVPKDDDYLKSILPELETLKMKIDNIVNSYLETIFDRKMRQRLKHEVFLELTKLEEIK